MPGPLSPRVPIEFTGGQGSFTPEQISRSGRGVAPSFGTRSQTLTLSEPVTVTLAVPSLTSGQSQVLTASQGLKVINAVSLAPYDLGQILVVNISASQVTNALISHPTIQVQSTQGTPAVGVLASGQKYTALAVAVTATIYAFGTVSAGTMTVTGTAILLGEALAT